MNTSITYRKLHGWKYLLLEPAEYQTGITLQEPITHRFIWMTREGLLIVRKGYAWDGASGPAIDTDDFIRGSLMHDCLYQLMRLGLLSQTYRKRADEILYEICRADGMPWLRAQWVYYAVRCFAGGCAKRRDGQSDDLCGIDHQEAA